MACAPEGKAVYYVLTEQYREESASYLFRFTEAIYMSALALVHKYDEGALRDN